MESLILRARIGVLGGKGRSTGGRLEISGFGALELDNPKEKPARAAAPFLPFLDSRTQATSGRPEHSRTLPVRAGPSSEATLTVADWPENRIHVLLNCPSPSQPRSPLLYSPSPLGRRRLACSSKPVRDGSQTDSSTLIISILHVPSTSYLLHQHQNIKIPLTPDSIIPLFRAQRHLHLALGELQFEFRV